MMLPKAWRSRAGRGTPQLVGITNVEGRVHRSDRDEPSVPVLLLVDSGAIYSVLPAAVWQQLGLVPRREVDFGLAGGTVITRGVSECTFEIEGLGATSPVVLGRPDEGPLLGAVTLETLGLVLHPLTRRLVPMRLLLATLDRPSAQA